MSRSLYITHILQNYKSLIFTPVVSKYYKLVRKKYPIKLLSSRIITPVLSKEYRVPQRRGFYEES